MKVSVTTIPITELDVDVLLVPVGTTQFDETMSALEESFGACIRRSRIDFAGKDSQVALLYPEKSRAERIVLIGMGDLAKLDLEKLRKTAATGAGQARSLKTETAAIVIPSTTLDMESSSQALVEGFILASYRFLRYKTSTNGEDTVEIQRLVLHAAEHEKLCRAGAERGRIVSESVITARDLVNLSPDEKTPTLMAKAFEKLAKKYGFEADIWDKALIVDEQMGGLLAVNRGSVEPPTFTVLTWQPDNPVNEKPIVLIGKGVVFDTGGLSLKPTKASMDFMKSDMAGAAAVIGTMEAVARLSLPLYVVGLIPATDNRPGENAFVPGEVVRMHSGATVEVMNTDAEGRMLLADALSYAKNYKPELVIDLATLTGAAVIALGTTLAAVMTSEGEGCEERLRVLDEAGKRSGDRIHPLPLLEEFKDSLKSDIADLKNIGGREASSITAAKFLEHFIDYPWIHIDIAGPAFLHEASAYRPKGGTGFGVRLLVEYLRDYASPRKKSSQRA